jgi:hypothetical protein
MSLGELVDWKQHRKEYDEVNQRKGMGDSHDLQVVDAPTRRWLWIDNYAGSPKQWYLFDC